jgi:hypothetical protein
MFRASAREFSRLRDSREKQSRLFLPAVFPGTRITGEKVERDGRKYGSFSHAEARSRFESFLIGLSSFNASDCRLIKLREQSGKRQDDRSII